MKIVMMSRKYIVRDGKNSEAKSPLLIFLGWESRIDKSQLHHANMSHSREGEFGSGDGTVVWSHVENARKGLRWTLRLPQNGVAKRLRRQTSLPGNRLMSVSEEREVMLIAKPVGL